MDKPAMPSEMEKRVAALGRVRVLEVDYRPTGCDTAETYWVATDWNGKKHEFKNGIPRDLIDLDPDYNSVLRPRNSVVEKVATWKKWEQSNARELAEYKRLKEKFG